MAVAESQLTCSADTPHMGQGGRTHSAGKPQVKNIRIATSIQNLTPKDQQGQTGVQVQITCRHAQAAQHFQKGQAL